MARHRSRVSDSDAGRRLDAVVAELPGVGSRTAAERLVTAGGVLVDGQSRPKSFRLEGGEELDVTLPEAQKLVAESIALDIVYEDEHLLVVDKPAGLVVHPTGGQQDGDARARPAGARRGRGRSRPAGDRPPARSRHVRPPRRRPLGRGARPSVRGDPRATDRPPLRRTRAGHAALADRAHHGADRPRPARRTRHSLDTDTPREAVTWFEVRELLGARALLDVRLETGRTPDPRPPRGRRAARLRRPRLRRPRGPRPRAAVPPRPPPRVRAPVQRCTDRRRVAAPRGSRGGVDVGTVRRGSLGVSARAKCPAATIPQFETTDPATPPDGGAGALSPVPSAPAGAPIRQPKGSTWQSSP